jgi:hypothetical protein
VDPGIDDPAKADVRRIRALVQLGGTKPDISLFAAVLPPGIDHRELFSAAAVEATDPVEMAARVKRDLEAAARREADRAN